MGPTALVPRGVDESSAGVTHILKLIRQVRRWRKDVPLSHASPGEQPVFLQLREIFSGALHPYPMGTPIPVLPGAVPVDPGQPVEVPGPGLGIVFIRLSRLGGGIG